MQRAFEKIIEKFKKEKSKHRCDRGEFWCYRDAIEIVNQVASEYGGGWIPFTRRELTESEKAYFGVDSKHMLDCKLPDENEEILVTSRFKNELYVSTDTFMRDGSECYLDSGREFVTEVIAWQPLPEPYKAENK